MKREFVVERQGRNFVLYAGLLDAAHGQGLRGIRTTLLQVPADDNGHIAIVHAVVETEKGSYSGLGDASPLNVARPMVTCLIRMAETRAKARALRDAVNVGVAALEELGVDDDDADVTPDRGAGANLTKPTPLRRLAGGGRLGAGEADSTPRSRPSTTADGSASAPTANGANDAAAPTLATPAQVRAIYKIGRDAHRLTEAEVDTRCMSQFGRRLTELSKAQASAFIQTLQTAPRAVSTPTPA